MEYSNRWSAGAAAAPSRTEDRWVGEPAGRRGPAQLMLGTSSVAGFQHHHGMHPKVLWSLREGDRLQMVREPGNPHDEWAVALYTGEGARLGYLPRGFNVPIAALLDQGLGVQAAIVSIHPEAEPWQRVVVGFWIEPRPARGFESD